MDQSRFQEITSQYGNLRLAILGDFSLDRYLEIDPSLNEISIETGKTVFNVTRVRGQPGAAGTILNNLEALEIGEIHAIGFHGEDGEGFELRRALQQKRSVNLDAFIQTTLRRTFTYAKPLLLQPGKPPEEMNRLDFKNHEPTPEILERELIEALRRALPRVDGLIVMDQVDQPSTGVVTPSLLDALDRELKNRPDFICIADSRRGLKDYPPLIFKMNSNELARLCEKSGFKSLDEIQNAAAALANRNNRPVIVSMAENGILAANPEGDCFHSPALPTRGPIDVVGAGDSVTANLAAALASKAGLDEAIALANAAASAVIHQLGTTGTAAIPQLRSLLFQNEPPDM